MASVTSSQVFVSQELDGEGGEQLTAAGDEGKEGARRGNELTDADAAGIQWRSKRKLPDQFANPRAG